MSVPDSTSDNVSYVCTWGGFTQRQAAMYYFRSKLAECFMKGRELLHADDRADSVNR